MARDEIIAIGREQQVDADPLKFFASMARSGGGGVREPVVEAARRTRQRGVKSALLTNNVAAFREQWRRSLPLQELFHEVVDSSEVAMRKPDPRIFLMTLERLGVAPERAIFLDDYPGNIDAANALGIRGVLVADDPSGALADLEALLDPPA